MATRATTHILRALLPPACLMLAGCLVAERSGTLPILTMTTVQLYYHNPAMRPAQLGGGRCSEEHVFPVERTIAGTQMPIYDALWFLIRGDLTDEERQAGFQTAFPLRGLELRGAVLEDGLLTVEFDDPYRQTCGGVCRVKLLRAQVEKTARQFPGVESVRILPQDVFQP